MGLKRMFLVVSTALLVASGCNNTHPLIEDEGAYLASVESWQQARLERLKDKNGWLSLAGLYWLEEGENSFGSDNDNDIVFPGKADAFCGTLTLTGDQVRLDVKAGIDIQDDSGMVTNMILSDDHTENTTRLQQGDLAWYVIKRGEKYGIRLRDHKHPRIDELQKIPSFPVDTRFVVEATLESFEIPKTITVATPVEGLTESYRCPGELHFSINRKEVVLYPFISGNGYFLVFADETTGIETYGAGRFMYAIPDSAGRIILDFNRAYNPPCAFSPFATCPMPPRENILEVSIRAGEKSVHLH